MFLVLALTIVMPMSYSAVDKSADYLPYKHISYFVDANNQQQDGEIIKYQNPDPPIETANQYNNSYSYLAQQTYNKSVELANLKAQNLSSLVTNINLMTLLLGITCSSNIVTLLSILGFGIAWLVDRKKDRIQNETIKLLKIQNERIAHLEKQNARIQFERDERIAKLENDREIIKKQ